MEYRYRKLSTVVRRTDGTPVFVNRGDVLPADIDPEDLEYLIGLGSVDEISADAEDTAPVEDGDPQHATEDYDARGKDVAELVAWLRDEQPTVDEVIAAAWNDADAAAGLLEAEAVVTEDAPRKGVQKGLEALIAS